MYCRVHTSILGRVNIHTVSDLRGLWKFALLGDQIGCLLPCLLLLFLSSLVLPPPAHTHTQIPSIKSPMYTQKSPMYPSKSQMYPPKSHIMLTIVVSVVTSAACAYTHTHHAHTHHNTPTAAHTNTPTMFTNDLHSYTHATHVCEEARGGKNTPAHEKGSLCLTDFSR